MPHANEMNVPHDQERRALDDVFSLIYEELRSLASAVRRRDAGATLSSTALVHEAWLKLRDSPHFAATSVPHFKAIAAKAMRQVLVDAARRRNAQKRGAGERIAVEIENCESAKTFDVELLGLDQALKKLSDLNARQAMVIEYRFFGGLTVPETAALLDVSESVVERDWRAARALLLSVLDGGKW
jgi:RNA polymerase sigma factor (TIGR02999 family)